MVIGAHVENVVVFTVVPSDQLGVQSESTFQDRSRHFVLPAPAWQPTSFARLSHELSEIQPELPRSFQTRSHLQDTLREKFH